MTPEWLGTKQAAAYLQVSLWTLKYWVRLGRIVAHQPGGPRTTLQFYLKDLETARNRLASTGA